MRITHFQERFDQLAAMKTAACKLQNVRSVTTVEVELLSRQYQSSELQLAHLLTPKLREIFLPKNCPNKTAIS